MVDKEMATKEQGSTLREADTGCS